MYGYSNWFSFPFRPIAQPASFSQPTLTSSSASREEAEMIDLDKDLIQTQVTAPTTAESSSPLDSHESCHDIGELIIASKSIDETCCAVGSLTNSEIYSLLFHHVSPPHEIPSTFSFGCNRKFNVKWLEKYPWLRYSPKLDAVFCGPCALLVPKEKRKDKGLFVGKAH